jgi:hypothetical protein
MNNERQECKICTVCGTLVRGERVNGGDEGEDIWLMEFIYIHKTE